jgi:Ulp1 family protease
LEPAPLDGKQLTKAQPPEHPDQTLREWPAHGRTQIVITEGDLYRLEEGEELNDKLIELGLKHHLSALPMLPTGTSQALTQDCIHLFNTFFYKKLLVGNNPGYKEANPNGPSWQAYETVRSWTNKVDIFEKKMLIIPINETGHWYLAVILNPGAVLKKENVKTSTQFAND